MPSRWAEHTERFTELVERPDASIPLDEAALEVAAHAQPHLDVAHELSRIDDLASRSSEPTLHGVLRLLFRDGGFAGNRSEYYDPRNSFLNEVLNRRVGIPISLSLLMMEIGRRLGVPLSGVGMPGHFLVRDKVDPSVFVDAFAGGVLLDGRGCERLFRTIHGPRAPFEPHFLDPVPRFAILARLLANLRALYSRSSDVDSLLWVTLLSTRLPDADDVTWHDYGAILSARGRYLEAARAFEYAAGLAPDRAEKYQRAADRARANLN